MRHMMGLEWKKNELKLKWIQLYLPKNEWQQGCLQNRSFGKNSENSLEKHVSRKTKKKLKVEV